MNLLILSCGTRDKVVQYFKKAFAGEGRIVCTDASPYAPALYEMHIILFQELQNRDIWTSYWISVVKSRLQESCH